MFHLTLDLALNLTLHVASTLIPTPTVITNPQPPGRGIFSKIFAIFFVNGGEMVHIRQIQSAWVGIKVQKHEGADVFGSLRAIKSEVDISPVRERYAMYSPLRGRY